MVVDKFHARALGPINQIVRQPTEGRARQGGLRIGEMERDCLISHGTTNLLWERLLWSTGDQKKRSVVLSKSDAFRFIICAKCGRATCHDGTTCAVCSACDRSAFEAVDVVVPYSFKLLMQEINALCIDWQTPMRLIEKTSSRDHHH